jgi:hypothetical protein
MDVRLRQRMLRNYRHMAPSKFYVFNQGVRKGIAGGKIPTSIWGGNPDLPGSYLTASEKHDDVFHEAKHGSDLVIMQRDALQQQIVEFLDEMASVLEAASVRNPELLLNSGYDLAKERRGSTRAKPVVNLPEVATSEHQGSN